MKKQITTILLFANFLLSFSQAPQAVTYQAVATNASGLELISSPIGVRASIVQGVISNPAQYIETFAVTTDTFGLFTINIGQGVYAGGTLTNFNQINWGAGPFFLKIEMDATGGSNYAFMGANQLLSVPYSLYAQKSDTANYAYNSLNDADTDSTNEIQVLTQNGDTIILSNGGGSVAISDDTCLWKQNGTSIYYNTGNVGIGNINPIAPLSFNGGLGDRISFFGLPPNIYGFGLQNTLLQMYSGYNNSDIAFGYGSSNNFTENVRFTGTGNVGIGVIDPKVRLSFDGGWGDRICFYYNSPTNMYGLGTQNLLFQMYSDVIGSDIAFGYGSSASFNENVRFKGTGNVGIGTNSPSYRLHVNGTVAGVGAYVNASDSRYKKNITPIAEGLSLIQKMKPVSYDWNKEAYPNINFENRKQLGFLAQDIESIVPEAVTKDDKGFYGMTYTTLIPVMVKSIQELEEIIKKQNKRIEELEKK